MTRTFYEWRKNKYERYQQYLDEIHAEKICVKYLCYENIDDFGGLNCPCRRDNTEPVTISGNFYRIQKGRICDHLACETHCKFLMDKISKKEYDDHIAGLLKHYNKTTYEELKEFMKEKNKKSLKNDDKNHVDKSKDIEENFNDDDIVMLKKLNTNDKCNKNNNKNNCNTNNYQENSYGNNNYNQSNYDHNKYNQNDYIKNNYNENLNKIGRKTISLLSDVLTHLDSSSIVSTNLEQPIMDENMIDKDCINRQKRMNTYLFANDINITDPNFKLYQSTMAALRLMYKMAITNAPIYKFAEFAETVADFGGYEISDHLSQTSATDFLLTLGEAQQGLDNDEIKHAKTIFATIDAQSKNHDSWTAILSHIRDRTGIKKTIFTHGEYKVKKSAIEAANEKQLIDSAAKRIKRLTKKSPKKSRFQFGNYINSTGVDIDVVSNHNNSDENDNKIGHKSDVKPSHKLQLWFEDVYDKIGIDWERVNGLGTDGGTTEKSGMQRVCVFVINNVS